MSSMVAAMMRSFSSGLSVGKSASKDLIKFMDCFQPLAEKTDEAQEARKKAFSAADPNGNGLCSLAELELEIDDWALLGGSIEARLEALWRVKHLPED